MGNRPDKAAHRPGWLLALCVFCAVGEARAQQAPVVNTAAASYASGPSTLTVQSNQVSTPIASQPALILTKTVAPAGTVPPGSSLTFQILLENPSLAAHTSVLVTDALDSLLGDPTAISTGDLPDLSRPGQTVTVNGTFVPIGRTVQWRIASVPPGARLALSFTTVLDPNTPNDAVVRNRAAQTSAEDPMGTTSGEVVIPVVAPALQITKQASRSRAEVGDLIGYTVEVGNISASLGLTAVRVRDTLPEGFRYLDGSAKLDGRTLADPVVAGGDLIFTLGDLALAERRRLSYVATANAPAEGKDGVNRAVAEAITPAAHPVTAGPAEAEVRVSGSLLTGEATIVGRVFVDDNRNGVPEDGEPGVPWARVYLEDGSFAMTDVTGKYHIEGVRPGLHVARVDERTLPDGLGSFASWSRSAGAASTQFVDVGSNQLFKTNAATGGWGLSVARLRARGVYRHGDDQDQEVRFPPVLCSALFEPGTSDLTRTGTQVVEAYAALVRERGGRLIELEVEPAFHPLEASALMAERAERMHAELRRRVLAQGPTGQQEESVASAPGGATTGGTTPDAEAAALRSLEERVKEMTAEPAVLSPAEGEVLLMDRASVEVKLPLELTPRLTVNGQEVPQDRIAVRMETNLTKVKFYRYLGVPFREGRNSVVLEGVDQWGNARVWVERIVDRTGRPARISLHPEEGSLTADGRTPVIVRAEVRDALGLPVQDGTAVTLESDVGTFLGTDADLRSDGFQAVTSQGVALVRLSPADARETRAIQASSGDAISSLSMALAPVMGPWLLTGMGEASVGQTAPSGATVDELLDDSGHADGRFAIFARGPLFGTSLMTMAYDSGREREEDQVFRKLAPDRYFPIYGDGSRQGYEIEGQGRFTLRLDQRRSWLALGDFTTGLSGGDLSRYDRALTGAAGQMELNGLTVQSFGAHTPQAQVRDEMEGTGLSGPYRLSRRPVIINTERIVLETRDRFQPDRVLESRPMSRYSDYDVDYQGGTILFKRPVPFQDDSFNRIVVVAVYEALDGQGDDTVAGGRVAYRFGGAAELGTTYVNEERGQDAYTLQGADIRFSRAFGATALELEGEAASSSSPLDERAGAVSFRAGARVGSRFRMGASYRNVSSGFENPSRAGLSDAGTVRWGVDGVAMLPREAQIRTEFYHQQDDRLGAARSVGSLEWEQAFSRLTARSGVRGIRTEEPGTADPLDSRMVVAGLRAKLVRSLDARIDHQQVVSGAALPEYPTRTAVGLDWQVTEDLRGFLRQELDRSDVGDASRTIVGMESRLLKNLTLDSRYSLEDALTGERGAAQMGLRSRLPLNEDWLGDVSAERVAVVRGSASTGDFTSLGVGFEYLPARVKFTTRYELRLGEIEDQHVLTAAGATRITDDLSLFARQRVFLMNPAASSSRVDGDGLLGFAYRPLEDDRLNFLFKLQGSRGEGAAGAGSPTARAYLGVFETNYQPIHRVHLLGRLAVRQQRDAFEGQSFSSLSRLAETRALVDIGARWNAGVSLRVLDQPTTNSTLLGYGAEAGCRLIKDTWLVAGWNVTGFRETGFGDTDRRTAGPFLTVRFKFDESSVTGLAEQLRKLDGDTGRLPARPEAPDAP
ncbi:MAG: hypothetical protein ACREAA_14830 [Candidatus Polarisedimenticolia bacterium]